MLHDRGSAKPGYIVRAGSRRAKTADLPPLDKVSPPAGQAGSVNSERPLAREWYPGQSRSLGQGQYTMGPSAMGGSVGSGSPSTSPWCNPSDEGIAVQNSYSQVLGQVATWFSWYADASPWGGWNAGVGVDATIGEKDFLRGDSPRPPPSRAPSSSQP